MMRENENIYWRVSNDKSKVNNMVAGHEDKRI